MLWATDACGLSAPVQQDLKKNGWVARRELFTAKKIDEVRAQAEAELGLISSTITGEAALHVIPGLPWTAPHACTCRTRDA